MLFAMRLTLTIFIVATCSRQPHDPLRSISEDVRAGRYTAVAARIAAAPLPERPRLAFRAAADAPASALPALAAAATEPELAAACADRLEQQLGPRAALAARERAAAAAPDRAEQHDALARARLDAGQLDAALAAWDRAAELAPLQPTYRLLPIRALAATGDRDRACARAAAIATSATTARDATRNADASGNVDASRNVDALLLASNAAAACGDRPRAVELARAARDLRPPMAASSSPSASASPTPPIPRPPPSSPSSSSAAPTAAPGTATRSPPASSPSPQAPAPIPAPLPPPPARSSRPSTPRAPALPSTSRTSPATSRPCAPSSRPARREIARCAASLVLEQDALGRELSPPRWRLLHRAIHPDLVAERRERLEEPRRTRGHLRAAADGRRWPRVFRIAGHTQVGGPADQRPGN